MNSSVWILVVSVFIASCSQIILKTSAGEEHENIIKEYMNARVIIGYGMMVVSTVLTILAFRGLEYKYGPVIESLGYVFVMILGNLFLKEKITKKKLLGNGLILLGIFIFNM